MFQILLRPTSRGLPSSCHSHLHWSQQLKPLLIAHNEEDDRTFGIYLKKPLRRIWEDESVELEGVWDEAELWEGSCCPLLITLPWWNQALQDALLCAQDIFLDCISFAFRKLKQPRIRFPEWNSSGFVLRLLACLVKWIKVLVPLF